VDDNVYVVLESVSAKNEFKFWFFHSFTLIVLIVDAVGIAVKADEAGFGFLLGGDNADPDVG